MCLASSTHPYFICHMLRKMKVVVATNAVIFCVRVLKKR
ncbi:hypothetical protein AC45_5629 [Escherichia coli 2-210-07_S3_C3]|nr:hypothetical protein AC45_5629 [Escherichia coli 2-210-07_S3_C3]